METQEDGVEDERFMTDLIIFVFFPKKKKTYQEYNASIPIFRIRPAG